MSRERSAAGGARRGPDFAGHAAYVDLPDRRSRVVALLAEPCRTCGRNLLEMRRTLSIETLRGAAPLCPIPRCPIVAKLQGFRDLATIKGKDVVGPSPPSVFVGRYGYPNVDVGPLLPPVSVEDAALLDAPTRWLSMGLGIEDVLSLRSRLLRSRTGIDVRDAARPDMRDPGHVLATTRDIALAARPVDTEVTLEKPLKLDRAPRLDGFSAPMGPSVPVVAARVTTNVSPPRRVDDLVSDVHAPAAVAVRELAEGGIAGEHIQRLLSAGLLGERARRRFVPTRWAITATDDMLGKDAIEGIRGLQQISEVRVHESEIFGNRFFVLLLPSIWSFEMVEMWEQGGEFMSAVDAEDHRGRSRYADNVTGAYYAARLGVLEHLRDDLKRQAAALVYREITPDYWAPLGVWVIREGVRVAMQAKGLVFEDVASAAAHVTRKARAKSWRRESTMLDRLARQRRLDDFV